MIYHLQSKQNQTCFQEVQNLPCVYPMLLIHQNQGSLVETHQQFRNFDKVFGNLSISKWEQTQTKDSNFEMSLFKSHKFIIDKIGKVSFFDFKD